MNVLTKRPETDYRIIHLVEDDFKKRVLDMYDAVSTQGAPPYLDVILDELWDIMVFAYVISVQGTPAYDRIDVKEVEYIARTGDIFAAYEFIMNHANDYFREMFHQDVYLFLVDNHINFLVRPLNKFDADFGDCRLINPAIVEVW